MWQGSPSVFTAMFKAVEDRINVKADSEYGVGTILIVEDSVKFYSSYLPLLYSELWRQNRTIQSETMHAREHILRLHSRPKVLFCTNFEEAMDVFDRYQNNIFGVITDLAFPKQGVHTGNAGLRFAAHVKEIQPELPVLMQSQSREDSKEADAARSLGLKFVCKQSPVLLQSLREFLVDDLMFGPLKFRDGDGAPLGGASTVAQLLQRYEDLPLSAVGYHARHSHLSRWFFARAPSSSWRAASARPTTRPTSSTRPARSGRTGCATGSSPRCARTATSSPPPSRMRRPPTRPPRSFGSARARSAARGAASVSCTISARRSRCRP